MRKGGNEILQARHAGTDALLLPVDAASILGRMRFCALNIFGAVREQGVEGWL